MVRSIERLTMKPLDPGTHWIRFVDDDGSTVALYGDIDRADEMARWFVHFKERTAQQEVCPFCLFPMISCIEQLTPDGKSHLDCLEDYRLERHEAALERDRDELDVFLPERE